MKKRLMLLVAAVLTTATLSVPLVEAQSVCVTYTGVVCGGDGLCCAAVREFCIEWQCDY